jgi:hypothetical protein
MTNEMLSISTAPGKAGKSRSLKRIPGSVSRPPSKPILSLLVSPASTMFATGVLSGMGRLSFWKITMKKSRGLLYFQNIME